MARLVLLATRDGMHVLDPAGEIVAKELAGEEAVTAATGDGWCFAATDAGVVRRRAAAIGDWDLLGLAGARVWVVAAGEGGTAYVGVEPAALWRLGSDEAVELDGLKAVEGYEEWHSPWGPADLSSVVVDGARIVVGVEQGGVAVSWDRGATWEARNRGLDDDVHAVAVDGPSFYATTGMGFYRSIDEGQEWRWESDGLDRGYTQGLARSGSTLFVSSASGPPPMWERDGPDAGVFRASSADAALQWSLVFEGVEGNIERQALAAADGLVVAGTTAGEFVVGDEAGTGFRIVRDDLPPIIGVAFVES